MTEGLGQTKLEKPSVLYHASRNPNITIFEPRTEKTRSINEGPRVFATPSRALATVFIVDTDDSWVGSGTVNGVPYILISDEARFRALDTGGTIYSLPSDTFETNPNVGLRENEWASAVPVKPVGKEHVASALQAMQDAGVKVYFVDKKTFEEYRADPSSTMEKLTPVTS